MASDTSTDRTRDSLESEQQALRAQLSELTDVAFDDNFADSGQVAAEQGEAQVLAGSLREHLDLVEAALARLDAGSYGVCEQCGKQISDERLEAMPQASRCIDCA